MFDYFRALEDRFWRHYFKTKFGVPIEHMNMKYQTWTFAVWRKEDVPYLNEVNCMHLLEKLRQEFNDNPKTTVQPISGFEDRFNLLTKTGMTHAGKLNTGQLTTYWTHIEVGRGSTTETIDDTALQTAEKRKAFTSGGNAIVLNQTEKYSMVFYDTDMVSALPVTLTEAGIFHQAAGGDMYCRVTSSGKTINTGDLATVQVNVTHVNGTST